MAQPHIALPKIAHAFLRTAQGRRTATAQVVRTFHRWTRDNGVSLCRIEPHDVESFLQRPFRKSLSRQKRKHYERELQRYLEWLRAQGQLCFDPLCLGPPADRLPPFAKRFVESRPGARTAVGAFHHWLQGTHRGLPQLTAAELGPFLLQPTVKTVSPQTLAVYRRNALRYLDWLYAQGQLRFDPRDLPGRRMRHPLPSIAEDFVRTLEPVLKTSSLSGYRTGLRAFHFWLRREGIAVEQLSREHISTWLQWMHRRGLHPSTRLSIILQVRAYLRWLHDAGRLACAAEALLRRHDLPKLPQYLPRPLEPKTDRELQRRLRTSPCPLRLGLLLMRRTGLRIGELIGLPYDCMRTDPKGNSFLKVPLGKLDTERLVPLDPQTERLIVKLQRRGRRNRKLLLESSKHTRVSYSKLRSVLRQACRGLCEAEAITSHRLRHTYATCLLAGGMSLVGVMKLLGHRDHRMTLRYTAITDETVTTEYHSALARNEQRYGSSLRAKAGHSESDPRKLLADVARSIQKHAAAGRLDRTKVRVLLKRIRRLRTHVAALLGPSMH